MVHEKKKLCKINEFKQENFHIFWEEKAEQVSGGIVQAELKSWKDENE